MKSHAQHNPIIAARINSFLQRLQKESFHKEDIFCDAMLYRVADMLASVTIDDFYSSSYTLGIKKTFARQLEALIFDLAENTPATNPDCRFDVSDKEIYLAEFGGYFPWLSDVSSYANTLRRFRYMKSKLIRFAKTITLTEDEWFDMILQLAEQQYKFTFFDSDEGKKKLDAVESSLYFVTLCIIICLRLLSGKKLPLYRKTNGDIIYSQYDATQFYHQFKSVFKALATHNPARIDREIKPLLSNINSLIFSYITKFYFVATNCNDLTVKLFDKPYSSLHLDHSDGLYHSPALMRDLTERPALLPSSGVIIPIDEGDLEINEIITEDDQIFVCFRYVLTGVSHFLVYDIMRYDFVCYDITVDHLVPETDCCILSSYSRYGMQALVMYREVLDYCSRQRQELILECEHEVNPKLKFRVNDCLYSELKFINGYPRKLPEGSSASYEALQSAKAIGLKLEDNETYVRSFFRSANRSTYTRMNKSPLVIELFQLKNQGSEDKG